jgi:hypothetical protein
MSAAQVAGTPAAAPAPAPAAEPVSAGAHGLDAVLGDLSVEETSEIEAPEGEVTEAATETTEQPRDKAQKLDDEVIFSEEALQTAEGVTKARGRLKELQRKQHEAYIGLKGYEKKVVARAEKLKHNVAQYKTQRANDYLLINNVRSNLQATHSGDPEQILTGLGALTGMDGLKALELLNHRLINRGQSAIDPQIQQVIDGLKGQIEELKGGFTERETQAKIQERTQSLKARQQELGQRIANSASALPNLSRLYSEDSQHVINHITEELRELHQSGARLDIQTYLSNLEQQLARHLGASQAPQGDGGGPAPKQPVQAQRSPGQSVGPRSAAASTPRVPTEEESLRALANDHELLSSLGL